MATQIGTLSPFSVNEFLTEETKVIEELSNQAFGSGVNLAQLIAQTYLRVEQNAQGKTHLKIDVLESHQKKLGITTNFLTRVEAQLSDENIKEISLTSTQVDLDLLGEMRQIMGPHQLLNKDTWTRKEAQAIQQALTRDSQVILQQASQSSSEVNRAIEEGMELLQIARKCLEMLDRLHQTFTSNQRSR
jgi:hypothetical protein